MSRAMPDFAHPARRVPERRPAERSRRMLLTVIMAAAVALPTSGVTQLVDLRGPVARDATANSVDGLSTIARAREAPTRPLGVESTPIPMGTSTPTTAATPSGERSPRASLTTSRDLGTGATAAPTVEPAATSTPLRAVPPTVPPPPPVIAPPPTPVATATPPRAATPTAPVSGRGPLTLAVEFDNGLEPFEHDGQWGTGFARQSDFMGDLRQVTVANGVATITAERKATPSGMEWASAVMSTRGRFAQQYGYFEARIRYDAGNGLWPAFWMNPADGSWPPEIDILEAYPNTTAWPGPNRIYSTLHYSPANLTHEIITNVGYPASGGWHVYGLDWRPGVLTFYFDGAVIGRITEDVPTKPFYLILNLAVGNWSAVADGTTPSPARMQIDWVRVYQ